MTDDYKYDEKTNSYVPKDDKSAITSNEKIIAVVLWSIQFFDITFWPIIVTIVAYVYYKDKSEFLGNVTKQIINFEITLLIYAGVATLLALILLGFLILPLVGLYHIIIPIIGIMKALDLKVYKPHFTFNFLD